MGKVLKLAAAGFAVFVVVKTIDAGAILGLIGIIVIGVVAAALDKK